MTVRHAYDGAVNEIALAQAVTTLMALVLEGARLRGPHRSTVDRAGGSPCRGARYGA